MATAEALEARNLDDPGLAALVGAMAPGRPAGTAWDLDTLTLAAVYFHPDLDVAAARVKVAEAGVTNARQVPNPTLDLSPQYNTTTLTPSPWTVGAAVNLLVETFGKRGYRIEEARDLVEAARDDVRTTAWQVRARVRAALIDLWFAEQRRALSAARLADEDQLVALLEHRQAAGDASALDVTRERSSRDQAALAVRDAEGAISAARADLAAAIGVPVRALDAASIDLGSVGQVNASTPTTPETPDLRRRALTGRSDVQAALAAYAAADAGLRLELAGRYPNLTLGASYTYDQGDNKFGLAAASIELPIFNQRQGPIAVAASRRQEAAASFLALQARVVSAIDSAAAAERGARASLGAAVALEDRQQERQARVAKTFAAGQIDRPALLAGEVELDSAHLARLDAETARLKTLGQLEDALQQPLLSSGVAFADIHPPPRPELEQTR